MLVASSSVADEVVAAQVLYEMISVVVAAESTSHETASAGSPEVLHNTCFIVMTPFEEHASDIATVES